MKKQYIQEVNLCFILSEIFFLWKGWGHRDRKDGGLEEKETSLSHPSCPAWFPNKGLLDSGQLKSDRMNNSEFYYIHGVYRAFHGWKSRSCEQLYRKPWVTGSRDRLQKNPAQMDQGRGLHKTGEWSNWPSLVCQGPEYSPVCDRVVTTQCIVWQTEWDKLER